VNTIFKPKIEKIVQALDLDNPGLFFVDFTGGYQFQTLRNQMTLNFNFHYNGSQLSAIEKQLESAIANILSLCRVTSKDAYNKELALHDYLVKGVTYNDAGSKGESISIVGALLSRRAVCEGYARAFHLLCNRAGLPSIVVTGKGNNKMAGGREEAHAWNIVSIDGVHSHVDVTLDS
jgi:transglutaminase/protease-like cytokinesis protein 3